MADTPLISIVIPAYNYAEKLSRAVNSVLRQLTEHHELIVIDDGSTDNTQAVLAELLKENSGFRVVYKENGGSASARNLGIREAVADYLIFLDADDELDENALSLIEQHVQHNPLSRMIIGGYTTVLPNETRRKVSLPADLPEDRVARVQGYLIDKKIAMANGATVLHRSIFAKGLYPEHFRTAEDLPVFAQALGNYHCSVLVQSLALIHRHTTSLRHNVKYDREVGMTLVDEIFSSQRLSEEFKTLQKSFVVQRALSLFRSFYVGGCNKEAIEMYFLAVRNDWRAVFKRSYTTKFLRALFRKYVNDQ